MTPYSVRASRIIDAPIAVVWEIVADARAYSTWTPMTITELEQEGSPTPDGVGAVRRFGTGPITSREEVVEFEPPVHLSYILLSGLPIDRYRAHVRLSALGDRRTRLTWQGSFEARPPVGPVMRAFLHVVLGDFVRRVARTAPTRAT